MRSHLEVGPSDIVPVRQTPQLLFGSIKPLTNQLHALACTGAMAEGTAVQTPAPFQPCSRYPAGDPWERCCYPAGDPRERSCYPAGDPREQSCCSTPCGARCPHAWAAGHPNRRPRQAVARHRSVDGPDDRDLWTDRGWGPVGCPARPGPTRGHRRLMASLRSQGRPDAAVRAPRPARGWGLAPDVRACAVRSGSSEGSRKRSPRRCPPRSRVARGREARSQGALG